MSGLHLSLGVAILLASTLAVAAAAWHTATRCWPAEVAARAAGALVLSVAAVILILEGLGSIGWLSPASMLLAASLVWLATATGLRTTGARGPSFDAVGLAGRFSVRSLIVGLPVCAMAVLLIAAFVESILRMRPEFDALAGHLPVPTQCCRPVTRECCPTCRHCRLRHSTRGTPS